MRVVTFNPLPVALPLPLPSGIQYFPALNRVYKYIMPKYEHLFSYIDPLSFLKWDLFNHMPPDSMGQLDVF